MFSKSMRPCCAYCKRSRKLSDGEPLLCTKMGVVSPEYDCKAFQYDPLKRIPDKKTDFFKFSSEDFSLDSDFDEEMEIMSNNTGRVRAH